MKSTEGNTWIRPASGRSSCSAHGVGRERESEPREREREKERKSGRGWVDGCARLQFGIRGRSGKVRWPARGGDRRSSVTEQVKQSASRTVRRPKWTVREARCYRVHVHQEEVRRYFKCLGEIETAQTNIQISGIEASSTEPGLDSEGRIGGDTCCRTTGGGAEEEMTRAVRRGLRSDRLLVSQHCGAAKFVPGLIS